MSDYFPTEFAKEIGKANGLYPKTPYEKYIYDLDDSDRKIAKRARRLFRMHERMSSFQHLSISGTYEEALIAFDGVDLSEEQANVLEKVHASTTTWARGKLVDKILSHMENSSNAKEIKELSQTMMQAMGIDASDGGSSGSQIEKYVITKSSK